MKCIFLHKWKELDTYTRHCTKCKKIQKLASEVSSDLLGIEDIWRDLVPKCPGCTREMDLAQTGNSIEYWCFNCKIKSQEFTIKENNKWIRVNLKIPNKYLKNKKSVKEMSF